MGKKTLAVVAAATFFAGVTSASADEELIICENQNGNSSAALMLDSTKPLNFLGDRDVVISVFLPDTPFPTMLPLEYDPLTKTDGVQIGFGFPPLGQSFQMVSQSFAIDIDPRADILKIHVDARAGDPTRSYSQIFECKLKP